MRNNNKMVLILINLLFLIQVTSGMTWNINMMNPWGIPVGNNDVLIAVIDTGIDIVSIRSIRIFLNN